MKTQRPVLYLSGPMTGYEDLNFPEFFRVTEILSTSGFYVLNPAGNWSASRDVPRATCMRLDLQQVMMSDGVATLDGWEESPGALCEVEVALQLELPVHSWVRWMSIAESVRVNT